MEPAVVMTCGHCGRQDAYAFTDCEPDENAVTCTQCRHPFAIVGQLRARSAQEAISIGPSDARDDHVPIDSDGGDGHGA